MPVDPGSQRGTTLYGANVSYPVSGTGTSKEPAHTGWQASHRKPSKDAHRGTETLKLMVGWEIVTRHNGLEKGCPVVMSLMKGGDFEGAGQPLKVGFAAADSRPFATVISHSTRFQLDWTLRK